MGYHSKDVYMAKALYAVEKNRENAEVLTKVSDEDIDIIMNVCQYRHDLHANLYQNATDLFNTSSNNYDILWKKVLLCQDWLGCTIIDQYTPSDQDWHLCMDDEDKQFYKPDDAGDDDESSDWYQYYAETEIRTIARKLEQLNTAIEMKLKHIDEIHGTSLAPSGYTRQF